MELFLLPSEPILSLRNNWRFLKDGRLGTPSQAEHISFLNVPTSAQRKHSELRKCPCHFFGAFLTNSDKSVMRLWIPGNFTVVFTWLCIINKHFGINSYLLIADIILVTFKKKSMTKLLTRTLCVRSCCYLVCELFYGKMTQCQPLSQHGRPSADGYVLQHAVLN